MEQPKIQLAMNFPIALTVQCIHLMDIIAIGPKENVQTNIRKSIFFHISNF